MVKGQSQTKQKKLTAAQHNHCLREARDLIKIQKGRAPSLPALATHLSQHIPGVVIGIDLAKVLLRAAKDDKSKKVINNKGKLVSRRASMHGQRTYEKGLMLWCDAVSKARKKLNLKGFVPVGGKSEEGKRLYAEAKDIYAKRGAVMRSPVKTKSRVSDVLFEEAKEQLQEHIPSMQTETLEIFKVFASAAESPGANDAHQEALKQALAEALDGLRLLQGDDNMSDVNSSAHCPRGVSNMLRELAAAFTSVCDEARSLQGQVLEQQQTIARLNQQCTNIETQFHETHLSAAEAWTHFCIAQDQRQQRTAEFLSVLGEACMKELQDAAWGGNLKAAAEVIEERRQQKINNFVREEVEDEAKLLKVCAEAAQDVKTAHEDAKKIAWESRNAFFRFAEDVNSSCERLVNITASNVTQTRADTLATEADQTFAAIERNLAAAKCSQTLAAEAQACERSTREWHAKESYARAQGLAGLWQKAAIIYCQDLAAAGS